MNDLSVERRSKFFHDWQPADDERLRTLWGVVSARQIAAQIGHGLTRFAIIGRAGRLGLKRLKIGKAPDHRPREPKLKPRKLKMDKNAPLGDMRLITILELSPNTCHWPIGDPREDDFRYCGLPKPWDGGPYCAHHHAKSLRCNEIEARP